MSVAVQPGAERANEGGDNKTAPPDDPQGHVCRCQDGPVHDHAAGEFRCACGALLGRRQGDEFELLCRRCKRRVVLLVKEIRP